MAKYYINQTQQANGDNEVHKDGCYWLSIATNKKYLGDFYSCAGAVSEAKKTYSKANGCATCSPECHTS